MNKCSSSKGFVIVGIPILFFIPVKALIAVSTLQMHDVKCKCHAGVP